VRTVTRHLTLATVMGIKKFNGIGSA